MTCPVDINGENSCDGEGGGGTPTSNTLQEVYDNSTPAETQMTAKNILYKATGGETLMSLDGDNYEVRFPEANVFIDGVNIGSSVNQNTNRTQNIQLTTINNTPFNGDIQLLNNGGAVKLDLGDPLVNNSTLSLFNGDVRNREYTINSDVAQFNITDDYSNKFITYFNNNAGVRDLDFDAVAIRLGGETSLQDNKIINLLDGTATKDAVNKGQLDNSIGQTESTGVISGCVILKSNPTTYSITAGTYQIYYNGIYSKHTYAGSSHTALGTQTEYVYLDNTNSRYVETISTTPESRRQRCFIGAVVIDTGNIVSLGNKPTVVNNDANMLRDLTSAIGNFNLTGNIFSPNGANLSIDKTSGTIYSNGSNYHLDTNDPSTVSLGVLTAPNLIKFTQTGLKSQSVLIDSLSYDVLGVVTPIGGGANQWQIQRVYSSIVNDVVVEYGQTLYTTIDDAIDGLNTEKHISTIVGSVLRAFIIVKKATINLQLTDNLFVEAGKYGNAPTSGGGTDLTDLNTKTQNIDLTTDNITTIFNGAIKVAEVFNDTDLKLASFSNIDIDATSAISITNQSLADDIIITGLKNIVLNAPNGAVLGDFNKSLSLKSNLSVPNWGAAKWGIPLRNSDIEFNTTNLTITDITLGGTHTTHYVAGFTVGKKYKITALCPLTKNTPGQNNQCRLSFNYTTGTPLTTDPLIQSSINTIFGEAVIFNANWSLQLDYLFEAKTATDKIWTGFELAGTGAASVGGVANDIYASVEIIEL
jgi:hypothetical protein